MEQLLKFKKKGNRHICKIHNLETKNIGNERFPLYSCPKCSEEKKRKLDLENMQEDLDIICLIKSSGVPKIYAGKIFEPKDAVQHSAKSAAFRIFEDKDCGVFIGKLGTGKTLLACDIIQEFIRTTRKRAKYVVFFRLISEIKDSWNAETPTLDVVDRYIEPELLVIDEIGLGFDSKTELIYITLLIDGRYSAGKKTILCGNVTTDELEQVIGDKAYRRIVENHVKIGFNWERYRKKQDMPG